MGRLLCFIISEFVYIYIRCQAKNPFYFDRPVYSSLSKAILRLLLGAQKSKVIIILSTAGCLYNGKPNVCWQAGYELKFFNIKNYQKLGSLE